MVRLKLPEGLFFLGAWAAALLASQQPTPADMTSHGEPVSWRGRYILKQDPTSVGEPQTALASHRCSAQCRVQAVCGAHMRLGSL